MAASDTFALRPRKLGYITVGAVLLYLGVTGIRNARIDALAHAAMDAKADPAIVSKLASYRGARSADLLLVVAGGRSVTAESHCRHPRAGRSQSRTSRLAALRNAGAAGISGRAPGNCSRALH